MDVAKRPMFFLSLIRVLMPLGITWFYLVHAATEPIQTAVFAVMGLVLTAASVIIVEFVRVPEPLQHRVFLGEFLLVVALNTYVSMAGLPGLLPAMFSPIAVTIFLGLPPRFWRPSAIAVLGGLFISSLPIWLVRDNLTGFVTEVVNYSVLILFSGTIGMMVASLMRERSHSMQLLKEVSDARSSLERAHRQLQETAATQHSLAVLEERQRLAREIHDSVAHSLTALVVQTQAGRRLLERGEVDRALAAVSRSEEMAREALQETRRAVRALHPSGLEQQSEVDALQRLARDWGAATGMGVTVTADPTTHQAAPNPERLEHLYRIFQEALTNAQRHGAAQNAWAGLSWQDGELKLTIGNDGKPPADLAPGVGLKSMAERARLLGGTLTVEAQERGLLITVTVPAASREATA